MSALARKLAALSSFADAVNGCRLHGTGVADPDPTRCPACREAQDTLDAVQAAAELEGRYREHGGALLAALDEARDLLQRHQPARLEQLERWAVLARKVRGF